MEADDAGELDDPDQSLVHAPQVTTRAPFGVIAARLGVSDRTVKRVGTLLARARRPRVARSSATRRSAGELVRA